MEHSAHVPGISAPGCAFRRGRHAYCATARTSRGKRCGFKNGEKLHTSFYTRLPNGLSHTGERTEGGLLGPGAFQFRHRELREWDTFQILSYLYGKLFICDN